MGPGRHLKRAPGFDAEFKARFESECWACDTPIEKGDLIKYDASDHVLHAPTCPELRRPRDRPTRFEGTNDDEMGY